MVGVLVAMPSQAQVSGACVLTPDSGEGPFYFDPSLERVDIRGGAVGAPLTLAIRILRAADCALLDGARVDIWHADAVGLYSGYERQPGVGGGMSTDVRGQTFLRGTQFTDAQGRVRFSTVFPSWYGNRTPHVHFKIFLSDRELIASQVFFPEEINAEVFERWDPYRLHRDRRSGFNANDTFLSGGVDGVFGDVAARSDGYDAEVTIVVAS
jgi:protocatechuate 3,4-dioxygenase beta subunit